MAEPPRLTELIHRAQNGDAEAADALGVRDVEELHDAREARGPDAREAQEQFADAERALGRGRVGPACLGDIECRTGTAVDGVLDRGTGATMPRQWTVSVAPSVTF